ncbi:MAG: DUF2726 domain-containing protein [Candidatus Thiodiazotropha sp. (ex Myrtea spinifera)]|nr:DUF2726 domain-containing protein [Candidatus Thiodiazotropha sp. (ex Myrtea spinifera)]
MEWIFIIILVLVVLVVLARFTKKTSGEIFGYKTRGPLFSKAERSFLGVLEQAITEEFRVLGKVRVADILSQEKGMNRCNWQKAFNKISAKHFDFVICNKADLSVMAVIELDDKSHNNQRRAARDEVLDKACESAGLIIVHFPAKHSYEVVAVRDTIIECLTFAESGEALNRLSQQDASKAGTPA